jgi:hypothetical protein
MFIALSLIGWFMYLDASYTPLAVVICVIVYNAFFGYSWVCRHMLRFEIFANNWT